jgi:hypothetical protein
MMFKCRRSCVVKLRHSKSIVDIENTSQHPPVIPVTAAVAIAAAVVVTAVTAAVALPALRPPLPPLPPLPNPSMILNIRVVKTSFHYLMKKSIFSSAFMKV